MTEGLSCEYAAEETDRSGFRLACIFFVALMSMSVVPQLVQWRERREGGPINLGCGRIECEGGPWPASRK